MVPSGGGIYNFSGATQLNQQDRKQFNFVGGSGTGFPAQPTFGTLPGQSQPLTSGQQPSVGGTFASGMQTSLGQPQPAAQGMFGFTSKPVIAPPQGAGSMGLFSMVSGGTPGGQTVGTPNLFQNTLNQPTGSLLQTSPGQTGQPKMGGLFGQPTGSTFSPQAGPGAQKPISGTNLFLGSGSNPLQSSFFNQPQNPIGLTQPQVPAGTLPTTPSMQARTGLQLGTSSSPFSSGAQPQGPGISFLTPSSTFKGTGTMLGTGTQVNVPTLFPGTQAQGTGRPFQGTGLTQLGTGIQTPGTGLTQLGTGIQAPWTGLTQLGPGTQAPGTSLTQLGTGIQAPGTSLTQLGTGIQAPGTSLTQLGTGAQAPGTSLTQLGTGIQAPWTGLTQLGPGTQAPGTGLTQLGTGTQAPWTGLTQLGPGTQAPGTGLTHLGTGIQASGTGLTLGTVTSHQIGVQPVATTQLPQMFSTPQNQPGMTSAHPQITPQKLTPQSAVPQGQSPLPQTLHMSHLLQTPGTQMPNIRPAQTSSNVTLSASPFSIQTQPARPAVFLLPTSQNVSLAPPNTVPTLIAPPATQPTQLPLTSITLPKPPQSVAPATLAAPTLTSTTAASSVPIVSLSAPTTSGLSSVTQTPAKKYTYRQLEDVINGWVMELDDQQKVFINQAKQVNAWDLALLENEDSIIALHDEVERAKTDQDRLDHDLNSILNQQAELEEMLAPLETYIGSQPMHASTQHADQERNKTYSMAEKIDGSMKDMLQNLREVLERINSVNAANSDRNNPISQITGILNAHMDSLLFIDESSNSLQQKLEELSRKLDSKKQDQEAKLKTAFN